ALFDTQAAGYNAASSRTISSTAAVTFISSITFSQGGWTIGDPGTAGSFTNTAAAGLTINDRGANTINMILKTGPTQVNGIGSNPAADTVTLAGVSTYTSATTITNATVVMNAATALGVNGTGNTSTITLNGGVLSATATMTFSSSRGAMFLGNSTAG